jgi:hypothetical protein
VGGRLSERGHQSVDLLIETGLDPRQLVHVVQVHASQQRMVPIETADEGLAQVADLGPHPGHGHLREDLRVAFTIDERLDHPPARLALDVGGDRVELDPSVLQQLLEPLGLPTPLGDGPGPIPGQVPQPADVSGRHEAAPQQTALEQLAQPGRVTGVGLAARQVLHVPSIRQLQLERPRLQHVPDRLPVHTGGLHRYL